MDKKDNKKFLKKVVKIVALGLMAFVLMACGSGNDEQTVPEAELTQEEMIEQEVEKRMAEADAKEEYNSKEHRGQVESTDALITEVINILEDNFAGIGYIDYIREDRLFTITPTEPQFMNEIIAILDGDLPESEWYNVIDGVKGLSETVEGVLGSGYGIVLMNPDNLDNMLLWVEDGTVVYEMLEEENVSSSEGMNNI